MRRLARISLICLAFSGLAATSASASVTHDGWGLGLADDTHIGGPAIPNWGQWFDRLRPKVFRMQLHWDADAAEIDRAKTRIFYLRAHGVQQVVVTFNFGDRLPDYPAEYGEHIGPIVTDMASIVDAWGPANEPNVSPYISPYDLVDYWQQFYFIVTAHDPSALKTSPDFADSYDYAQHHSANDPPSSLSTYLITYLANGGGWGDVAAFHPYWGVHFGTTATTTDFLAYVSGGRPVWLTEVGAFKTTTHHGVGDQTEAQQAFRTGWLIGTLGAMTRIQRIYYYSVSAGSTAFDTGLLNAQAAPRQAWDVWCLGTHNNNGSHPDCVH
jgi:hypothetical protein